MDRREALKALAGLGMLAASAQFGPEWMGGAGEVQAASPAQVYVAQGGSPAQRVRATFRALGGIERFVKRGSRVVLKPNIGFARTPEVAATTNPDVVGEVVRLCRAAGAASVRVYENPCDNYMYTFQKSGIAEAVRQAGGEIFPAHVASMYRQVDIPRGRVLRSAHVVKDVLEADCLINLPIAKVHGGAKLTIGLKNFMGLVWDRGFWHRNGLDACIADFATRLRPNLVLVDATRILTTRGPQGPGDVETPNTLLASVDPVAVDAQASTLFRRRPELGYLALAHRFGLGECDLSRIKVVRV